MPDRPTRFTLTNEHLTLLRHAYVGWDGCEFGAPAIDCKRPYGNSDVIGDMAKILNVTTVEDEWGDEIVIGEDADRLTALHRELQTALQLVLSFGTFEPGVYERENGWSKWERAQ